MGSVTTSHVMNGKRKKGFVETGTSGVKPLLKKSSKGSKGQNCNSDNNQDNNLGVDNQSEGSKLSKNNNSSNTNSIFRPLVVLANVNLFRRFSSQYRRLPQDPPAKDRLEVELDRLNNKIDSLLDKLEEAKPEIAKSPDEECIVCSQNKATMQTFPCGHQVVCRMCFVKTIQTAVSEKKLPLRCVFCRSKILRLKQHHDMVKAPGTRPPHRSANPSTSPAMPQSASNYSFNKMSSSSSNHSFASGVSSVSSGSSASSRSVRSFNFDSFSNFQSVNLINKSQLTRTTSGGSFTGWRRSRSPSPISVTHRSRSIDARLVASAQAQNPRITVDRTPSDESLSSCAQSSMTSPGSSTSPRSPVSPPWSTGSRSPGSQYQTSPSFFSTNPLSPGSPAVSPASPCGCPSYALQNNDSEISLPAIPPPHQNISRISRMCTPLSPIKESIRENGSSLELRCSPERSVPTPPPMSIEQLEMENLMAATGLSRHKKCLSAGNSNYFESNNNLNDNIPNQNYNGNIKNQPSSRIRCTDKILDQLEKQAKTNDFYSNKPSSVLYRGNQPTMGRSLSETSNSRMKAKHSKSVTFKDC